MKLRFFSVVVTLVVLAGCHNEPQTQYKERYDRFLALLNASERAQVKEYRFERGSAMFAARLAAGQADKRVFAKLLTEENIEIFPPTRVFSFFGGSVYSRILYYRFISFAGQEELDHFNTGNLLAMAVSLNSRLSLGSSALHRFRAQFPKNAPLNDVGKILLLLRHSPGGVKASPRFFDLDREAIVRFLSIRPDVLAAVEQVIGKTGLKYESLWEPGKAEAVVAGLPEDALQALRAVYPSSAASLKRFRIFMLTVFFRDVVDEKTDFFIPGTWAELRLLL